MPAKRRGDSASDTTEVGPKEDALLVRFVELLANEAVVEKLRHVLKLTLYVYTVLFTLLPLCVDVYVFGCATMHRHNFC